MSCPVGLNSLNIFERRKEVTNWRKFSFEQQFLPST